MAPINIHMRFPVALLFVNNIMLALSALAIVLRFWSRRNRKASLRLSDYMIILAWITNLSTTICSNLSVTRGGVGQHQKDSTLDEGLLDLKLLFEIALSSTLTLTLVKISALDLFISIFPVQRFRIAVYVVMGITTAYGIAFTVTTLVSCSPIQFNWDKTILNGKCIDTGKYYTAQVIISLVLDVIVVGLPMPMLWGLKMKLQRKVALTLIFGMGIFICIISGLRAGLNSSPLMKSDATLYLAESSLLGLLEANFSIISACLPLLQPVATIMSSKLKSIYTRSYTRITTNGYQTNQSKKKSSFGPSEEANSKQLQKNTHSLSYNGTTQASNTDVEIKGAASITGESVELDILETENTQENRQNIRVTSGWKVSSNQQRV